MIPTLILDTNILVAGLRSPRGAASALLHLVGLGHFTVGLTAALVLEYEAVLKRPGLIPLSPEDVNELLDYFCLVGKRRAVRYRLRPIADDPGDDLVIEAAVATGCHWIVTHNLRHVLRGAWEYNVEAISAGEALTRLGVGP